jgi:hypothetical protein
MSFRKLQPVVHNLYGRCIIATIYDPAIHYNQVPVWLEVDVEKGYPQVPMQWAFEEDLTPIQVEENLKFGDIVTSYKVEGKFAVLVPPTKSSTEPEYGTNVIVTSLNPEEGYGYTYTVQWHELTRDKLTADELLDFQIVVQRYQKDDLQPTPNFISKAQQHQLLPILVQNFESQCQLNVK